MNQPEIMDLLRTTASYDGINEIGINEEQNPDLHDVGSERAIARTYEIPDLDAVLNSMEYISEVSVPDSATAPPVPLQRSAVISGDQLQQALIDAALITVPDDGCRSCLKQLHPVVLTLNGSSGLCLDCYSKVLPTTGPDRQLSPIENAWLQM